VARISQRTLIIGLALILAIAGTFVYGARARRHIRYIRWQNEPIRPWMSVPFIAHTHHVSPEILYEAIGVQPRPHDRRPVRQLARAGNKPVATLIGDLESAIANARRQNPQRQAPSGRGP
jgi:hypothetical protein